jgi:uncharacterized protein (TIGR02145 family)
MNRLFLLLFGMVTFVAHAHAQVPDYVPTEGLVAWYPLDGDAVDASASNEAGELNGVNEAENRFNEPNTALQFEGAISFVNLGLENFLSLTEDDTLSIAIWAMPEAPEADGSGVGALMSKYQNSNLGSSWFVGYEPPYGFRILGDGTSGTPYPADWSSQCPNDPSGWSHLAVVFQGGSCVFWLNAEFVCESTFPVSSLSQEQPVLLGRTNCPTEQNCNQFSGKLDDVGFWNRALTEEEILVLYNAELPTPGCTDTTACNFDAEAMSDDGSCIPSGCMDSEACNYNALAECEGEVCDYTCCPGPGCCGPGTVWDEALEYCVPTGASCPQDLDFDGVVGVNDLMELLSAFGTDCAPNEEPESSEFMCGDPAHFDGHDYATVLIGDQCWFAENLRTEHYTNGDAIPANLSDSEWSSTTSGAVAVYGEDAGCEDYSPDGDACDPAWSLNEYGRLYNWYAVDDARGLCPTGWHVPTDGEWMTLEMELGMSAGQANSMGFRGTDQGTQMKTTYGWHGGGNGTNSSGFTGLPSGGRNHESGNFYAAGRYHYFWSSSPSDSLAWYRSLFWASSGVERDDTILQFGLSVRCLQDAE